jgi:hypothetical protein
MVGHKVYTIWCVDQARKIEITKKQFDFFFTERNVEICREGRTFGCEVIDVDAILAVIEKAGLQQVREGLTVRGL